MDCIYTAFLSKALHNIASESATHTHIHTPTAVSTTQAHQEELGLAVLLRDTSTLS